MFSVFVFIEPPLHRVLYIRKIIEKRLIESYQKCVSHKLPGDPEIVYGWTAHWTLNMVIYIYIYVVRKENQSLWFYVWNPNLHHIYNSIHSIVLSFSLSLTLAFHPLTHQLNFYHKNALWTRKSKSYDEILSSQ